MQPLTHGNPRRLPLSNITNTHNTQSTMSKHHEEPCYSFRMQQSHELKKAKVKRKSIEIQGPKLNQSRILRHNKPDSKLSKSNIRRKERGSMKETIDSLRCEVGLLHSKSQAMEKLQKLLCEQVRKLQDSSRVTQFLKAQTSKKLKVVDSMS